jgi:two-component system sensor histidine kinase VanS
VEKQKAIFERFYRLDEARSSNTGGAGLGLAIAKEIVERHAGRISVRSKNEITSFLVELPL